MRAKTLLLATLPALIATALTWSYHTNAHQLGFDLPNLVLWAWERPEDLRFLDARRAGVAFLAGTASISPEGSIELRPRVQRLQLPPEAALLAVVRIDSFVEHRTVTAQALASFTAGLRNIAALPKVCGLQIDFDARRSDRKLYCSLLDFMRAQIRKPIGVTALASWCVGDQWLDGEPIVEAVPMFFRMGRSESRDMGVESPLCRSSIGLSTDELWPAKRPAGVNRIYLFNPRAWTRADYVAALRRIEDWK